MKKYFLCTLIIASLLLTPIFVKAESSNQVTSNLSNNEITSGELQILSQTTKYYKTVTVYDTSEYQTYTLRSNSQPLKAISSETIEVSEEEYFSIDPKTFQSVSINAYTTVDTTYLSLSTSIGRDGQYFRYVDSLALRTVPSVRSYDVLAIGYSNNVKPVDGTMSCNLYYGVSDGSRTMNSKMLKTFSNGSSCMINLPNGSDVSSVNAIFEFRVQKVNPNETIASQVAVGDYRHAKETVSIIVANTHDVDEVIGISFPLKYESKYDIIPIADCYWNEAW